MDITFDDESYEKFISGKKPICNSRLRNGDGIFFDAMLSEEADLRTTAEGERIIFLTF